MPKPLLSLILPTRDRVAQLDRFLASLRRTTNDLAAIEVVLVVDEDDTASREYISHSSLTVVRTVVPPGATMGALNTAGYAASTGANIMLVNDDIEIRTRGWDEQVFDLIRSHPDGVYLIHVNDGIFEDKLCTFPLVSRVMCELHGGICPGGYRRYRIDDHIYNIFNLLSALGRNRLFYLPQVRFEHHNFVALEGGKVEYQPDPIIHGIDTELFVSLLPRRKEVAAALAEQIDRRRTGHESQVRQEILAPLNDAVSLRRADFVRHVAPSSAPTTGTSRVTIGVVTGNVNCDHAQACIRSLKRFTRNFELVVLDNNGARPFNHAHQMNRLIAACRTDYLVLLDDDVLVEAGWLDGMLNVLDTRTGVVTPCHKTVDGTLSYAGVTMRPDRTGHHGHGLRIDRQPARIQTLCSAAMLIDLEKCGELRFDERCSKYFQDIDYGLQVWEAGFEVTCATNVLVTHIAGATLRQGSALSNSLFEEHRRVFVEKWIDSGRYDAVENGIWRTIPEIQELLEVPTRLRQLLAAPRTKAIDSFLQAAHRFFEDLAPFPDLRRWVSDRIWEAAGERRPTLDDPDDWHIGCLLAFTQHPLLLEAGRRGYNLLLFEGEYYGVPVTLGEYDPRHSGRSHPRVVRTGRLDVLKAVLESAATNGEVAVPENREDSTPERGPDKPRVIEDDYKGFSVVRADRVYAVPVGTGRFKVRRVERGDYPVWFAGADEQSVRRQVDALVPVLVEEGRHGFNIVRYGKYFAIAQSDGAFDYARVKSGACQGCVADVDLEKLRRALDMAERQRSRKSSDGQKDASASEDRATSTGADATAPSGTATGASSDSGRWIDSSPVKEHGRVGELAIFSYEYKYFAIPQAELPFEYERFRRRGYTRAFVAHSLSELRRKIDERTDAGKVLVLARRWTAGLEPVVDEYVKRVGLEQVTIACDGLPSKWRDRQLPSAGDGDRGSIAGLLESGDGRVLMDELKRAGFGRAVISWDGDQVEGTAALEQAASDLGCSVDVVFPGGDRRAYVGEDAHRLVYNKAYVASMLASLKPPQGLELLEVGCSDGLVCDMMVRFGARKVTGIDVMRTTGCNYPDDRIEYRVMDATRLQFADQSFDWVYSIATFEHLPDPRATLQEMLRVLRVGGYGYVQAGPLYYSPFGHHMFAYFGDQPWIHLRRSKLQIARLATERGIAPRIEADLGMSVKAYVSGMLSKDHINGLKLSDYGLGGFRKRRDVQVLMYNVSKEGEALLTDALLAEIGNVSRDRLVEHGFELLFRKVE